MEKVRLGRTNLMVSKLGFGGIPIQRVPEDEAVAVVRKCLDRGINFIDTANAYTNSEEKIGKAISEPFRRKGIGRRLIYYLNEELIKRQVEQVVLHAQCSTFTFYKSCGFEESGAPFWEVGIKHIKMQKQL